MQHPEFMLAFALETVDERAPKNDPQIVKWIGEHDYYENGMLIKRTYTDTHPCTEKDFDKFYAPYEL